jgi:glycosyltransferase involved in cell wall biosynthesis
VRPYLARAALLLCPLRVTSGIANKVLEGMAMARPVVATPCSGAGIALVEGANVLYGTTAGQLAEAAVALLRDPERRRRMGEANRRLIESRYTWERVAAEYEALFEAIEREKGKPAP